VEDIKNKYKSDLQLDTVVEIYGETQFLDKFEGIAQEGTVEAVAHFALQMERAAVESYQSLADSSSGELKQVFQELADFERTHVDKISRIIKDLDLKYEEDPEEFHAH
jgi:rubrerythrin